MRARTTITPTVPSATTIDRTMSPRNARSKSRTAQAKPDPTRHPFHSHSQKASDGYTPGAWPSLRRRHHRATPVRTNANDSHSTANRIGSTQRNRFSGSMSTGTPNNTNSAKARGGSSPHPAHPARKAHSSHLVPPKPANGQSVTPKTSPRGESAQAVKPFRRRDARRDIATLRPPNTHHRRGLDEHGIGPLKPSPAGPTRFPRVVGSIPTGPTNMQGVLRQSCEVTQPKPTRSAALVISARVLEWRA
ncbi:hypothetical protein FB474_3362 [Oryzihumus leptocrescens]|uniref:Uncharacterized protein n=1 Tax=Oryzihumus leptocrescens TaxID=297536 RepID=A0A542ZNQ8_9MICO|nr:hypothetical protein FB474_3362 [Oryzihumus leptocrescens]